MDLIDIVTVGVENSKNDSNQITSALDLIREDYLHSHSADSYKPEDYINNKAIAVSSDDLIRFRHLRNASGTHECFVLDLNVAVDKKLLNDLEAAKVLTELKERNDPKYIVEDNAKLVGIIVNPSS